MIDSALQAIKSSSSLFKIVDVDKFNELQRIVKLVTANYIYKEIVTFYENQEEDRTGDFNRNIDEVLALYKMLCEFKKLTDKFYLINLISIVLSFLEKPTILLTLSVVLVFALAIFDRLNLVVTFFLGLNQLANFKFIFGWVCLIWLCLILVVLLLKTIGDYFVDYLKKLPTHYSFLHDDFSYHRSNGIKDGERAEEQIQTSLTQL